MKILPNLRFHHRSCVICRYYRIHKTGVTTSVCLLLGRTLTISGNSWDDRARVCDGWKKRPKTWNIYNEGVGKNPFWNDLYISRKTQFRLRGKKFEEAK